MDSSPDLTSLSDLELTDLWAGAMRELHHRELIRSWNNPVADFAERLVAAHLELELASKSAQGYDATDADGLRYQVKSRRLTPENKSRQLGMIRKIELNEFDFLIAVLFTENLTVLEMWKIPHHVVVAHGRWVPTLNGHRVWVKGPMLEDPTVERLI